MFTFTFRKINGILHSKVAIMLNAFRSNVECQFSMFVSEKETNLVSAYYVVKMFFQIYFYHNVKCRQEMYDKDILMLQVLCM